MKHIPRKSLLAALAFIAVALPSWAQAQTLSYDGIYSENRRGVTGNRSMEVRLYTTSTNGTIVAKETFPSVKITAGKFNIKYGNNGIADKLAGTSNWVAVAVAGVEQKPRVQIATVPFALHSGDTQALKSRIAALELKLEDQDGENYLQEMTEQLIWDKYLKYLAENPSNYFASKPQGEHEGLPVPTLYGKYCSYLWFVQQGAADAFDEWFELHHMKWIMGW